MKYNLKILFVTFIVGLLFISLSNNGKISAETSGNLFIEITGKEEPKSSNDRWVIRSRKIEVDFALLCEIEDADREYPGTEHFLPLNLFEDVYLNARIHQVEKNFSNGFSCVGDIEGIPGSQAVFVVTGDILSANVSVPGHFYQVRWRSGNTHEVGEIDQSQFPPELSPIPVQTGAVTLPDRRFLDSGGYIDVMVVYTQTARAGAGGYPAMENLIDLMIIESNTGYGNSGVNQRLRLVHTSEVFYNESGFNWSTALSRLKGTSDGYMDGIHTMRDAYGADAVVLIVNNTDSCGIAYVMQTVSTSFASAAFSVVSRPCATGYYSFAHELGHNMGSAHDRDNAVISGAYSYSYGYQAPDEAFRTIMAYNCPGGCTRVNYWSNPDNQYGGQAMGVVYTDPLAADNRKSLNETASTVANFRPHISNPPADPEIFLNRTRLYFSADTSGIVTEAQTVLISNSGEGTLEWTAVSSAAWLHSTPVSGTDSGVISVSVNPFGLAVGTYTAAVAVTDHEASNSPQPIAVTLKVYHAGTTSGPFGNFATPVHNSTVRSSIPVTGWVLDDVEVVSVKIYNGSRFVGDAVFVEGARPDVEEAYPGYPKNYRAGWGYMMLTDFLPNGGNGTYTFYARAADAEGNEVTLGSKTVTIDNANAVKPFGAIDSPSQGGTAAGSSFVNWGWVLTPQPNSIPTDGSTINLWVDGVNIGHPTYNIYRSDIAGLFPDYANSGGAVGYFYLDTTVYDNGVHTIQWTAEDTAGNVDGIGSRYFTIQNTGGDRQSAKDRGRAAGDILLNYTEPVEMINGYKKNIAPQKIYPDENGKINIQINELELLEIRFSKSTINISSLPVGSTMDINRGVFYWSPGPGFAGKYEFVFIDKDKKRLRAINIDILPKYSVLNLK